MDWLEKNYEMLKEETNILKKTFEKLEMDNQKIKETIDILKSKLDLSKYLFE